MAGRVNKSYKDPVQQSVAGCTRCALHKVYGGPVPMGLGQPGFLFIAEAPGREEDINGVPLSGISGRFLRQHAKSVGITPSRSSFCNVVSCRPHDNRDPSNYEKDRCRGNLLAQISRAAPRVIFTLGVHALQSLYPYGELKKDRRRVLYYGNLDGHSVWIVPTWHPAYIIRPGGRSNEERWLDDLRLGASLLTNRPAFSDKCRVCGDPVDAYDEMAGAWCKYHYKPVPRKIWQDEMFGALGEDYYNPDHDSGKGKKKVDKRAKRMGLI